MDFYMKKLAMVKGQQYFSLRKYCQINIYWYIISCSKASNCFHIDTPWRKWRVIINPKTIWEAATMLAWHLGIRGTEAMRIPGTILVGNQGTFRHFDRNQAAKAGYSWLKFCNTNILTHFALCFEDEEIILKQATFWTQSWFWTCLLEHAHGHQSSSTLNFAA